VSDHATLLLGYEVTTPWDALQVGYFISYASWNYLTAPFLLTYPGVQTRELEPWQEDGEEGPALRGSARSRGGRHLRRISDAVLPPMTTTHRAAKLGARTTDGFRH
jgi:hypothetical protein